MAITIAGETKCSICGEIIKQHDAVVGFPPFVFNKKDPLFTLNDASVHYSCLTKNKLYNEAYLFLQDNSDIIRSKICVVSGAEIKSPDDYFSLGFLTIHKDNPLYKYNFLVFNKQYFHEWKDVNSFIDNVKSEIESGNWDGDILSLLPTR